MQTEILVALIFLLTAYDAKLTTRRFNQYGEEVEVNKGIRWLSKLISPEFATIFMLFGPTLFWVLLFLKTQFVVGLGFIAGFKLRYFFNQLESVHIEKDIKGLKEIIESSKRSRALPSQSKSDKTDPSQTGPSKFK